MNYQGVQSGKVALIEHAVFLDGLSVCEAERFVRTRRDVFVLSWQGVLFGWAKG